MPKENNATKRARNYATVVYPDSAPENWLSFIQDAKTPVFISPLHDKDVNPTGEPKKPHFHVLAMYEGVKTKEQVKGFFESFGGVGCEVVNSIRGYARYLCHLDNPEKAQYDKSAVLSYGGADYFSTIGLAIDRITALEEMEEFCENYDVLSFYALCKYARKYRPDWSRILKDSGAVYMREMLKSRKWSKETNNMHIVDPVTGEELI